MSASNLINSLGLAFDILGAGLIWRFGLPAELSRSGTVYRAVEGVDEEEKAAARRYDRRSGVGFALLVLGFALQIVSNFVAG